MDPIASLFVPAVLASLMLVVGSTLTVEDFRRVAERPRAALWGTASSLLLPALLGAGLVLLARPARPVAAGLVLLAACPPGALSNYYAYLARADVALSVTLTACSIVASLVTLPVVATLSLMLLVGEDAAVDAPVAALLGPLVFCVLLPVAAGMAARARWPRLVDRLATPLRRLSLAAILALLAVVALDRGFSFHGQSVPLALLALALVLASLPLAFAVGRLAGFDLAARLTLAFEVGARNIAVAVLLGVTALRDPEFLVFGAICLLAQAPPLLAVAVLSRRLAGRRQATLSRLGGGGS